MNLSIVVPARKEPYLQNTIDDLFAKAKNEIEVIVILDGYWPDVPLKDRKNLIIIHRGKIHGMRSSINTGARIAKGKYLMKLDAHCCLDKDFDFKLMATINSHDWVIVPVRYKLDVEKWDRKGKPKEFQYIERGTLKGRDWPEYADRFEDGHNRKIMDLMTTQGSCWFMEKSWFEKIGGLDEINYGHMGREAQETCLKTWTNEGRFLLTRNTWYAHWNKPREHVVTNREEKQKSVDYATSYWTDEKIKSVIEKFAPVPGWDVKPKVGESIALGAYDGIPAIGIIQPVESTPVNQFIMDKYNLNGDSPIKVKGMNRAGLYKLFAELGYKTGCEVGVQRGRNALVMFQTIPDLKLYLIEPYKDHPYSRIKWGKNVHTKFKKMAHSRFDEYNAVWIEGFSEDISNQVPDNSLDFVYIDGNHEYDFIMLDVILWSRKVKEGGIISGHDYGYKKKGQDHVATVVDTYSNAHKITPIYLTDSRAREQKGDRNTSWFWVKEHHRGFGNDSNENI